MACSTYKSDGVSIWFSTKFFVLWFIFLKFFGHNLFFPFKQCHFFVKNKEDKKKSAHLSYLLLK